MFYITTSAIIIKAGTNLFVGRGAKIRTEGEELLCLHRTPEGRIEVSLQLNDEADRSLLTLIHNEWVAGDPTLWDMEFKPRHIRIRQRKGAIYLELDARMELVSICGTLWCKGRCVSLERFFLTVGAPHRVKIAGLAFFDQGIELSPDGMFLTNLTDPKTPSAFMPFDPFQDTRTVVETVLGSYAQWQRTAAASLGDAAG